MHPNFEVRPPERYMERFWCDQSPSGTVTAHIEQGCGGLHIHVLWSGLHLGPCFLLLSLPGFQVFLQAWLLDALQGTNTSDFPYDAQYGHWRHPKWRLYWAHLPGHCSSCSQLSPQAKLLITTFLCACRCYIFIHVISKTTSSDVCQAEFPASRGKTNLRETIMCLLLLLTTWKIPFCHRTSAHHSELQQICF